jgi:hypothetical protein
MATRINKPYPGIISISNESDPARYYFGKNGAAGKWYPSAKDQSGNYTDILFIIGGDSYEFPWESLEIDGNVPASLADANDLLGTLLQGL